MELPNRKGILKNGEKDGKLGRTVLTIGIMLFMIVLLGACGGKGNSTATTTNDEASTDTEVSASNNNSKESTDTHANSVDEQMKSYKVWTYGNSDTGYSARVLSQNFYSTEKGENIYLNITVGRFSDGSGYYGGLEWFVQGTPDNEIGTVMKFSPSVDNAIISFDDSKGSVWYGTPSQSRATFQINELGNFIERLKSSSSCTIDLETEQGRMIYKFNTNNLQWE